MADIAERRRKAGNYNCNFVAAKSSTHTSNYGKRKITIDFLVFELKLK